MKKNIECVDANNFIRENAKNLLEGVDVVICRECFYYPLRTYDVKIWVRGSVSFDSMTPDEKFYSKMKSLSSSSRVRGILERNYRRFQTKIERWPERGYVFVNRRQECERIIDRLKNHGFDVELV